MTAVITGADLRAIAPNHSVFSDRALAHALHVSVRQIPELRRQADQIQNISIDADVAQLVHTCGINCHEAEAYLSVSNATNRQDPQGHPHG
ncbi:hypothetical protein [Xanthomonas arboricola]|uniref:hypothetical protein n=1 Tax=Xanthomonas arboricola TaxID=56448 RepID=UPI0032E8598B